MFKQQLLNQSSLGLSLVLGLSLAGCATSGASYESRPAARQADVQPVMPVPSARSASAGAESGAALLMIVDFENREGADIKETQCRWRVINTESNKSYFINFSPEAKVSYTGLPPGKYATGRLGCGVNKVWDLDKVYPSGFRIEAGQTSYLGKLVFDFQGRQLKEVKKGSRAESQAALADAYSTLPSGSEHLVSAFTMKPIPPAMYKTAEIREGFDIQAAGLKNASQALDPLAQKLKTCANSESATDPLRIGRLEYVGLYKQGKFVGLKSRNDENAFSDRLRGCVEQSIMKYQASDKSDFEVRVKY